MRRRILTLVALAGAGIVAGAGPVRADVPVTLRGSAAAMARQHSVAQEQGYPFVRSPAHMTVLEAQGQLVRLDGNDDYGFRAGVSSLVARAEMRVFIERLSADYRAACGEQLIVTSLTRPLNRQPRNAHRLSVHPAGIAVDLRVSQRADCRRWLEATLLDLEEQGLLDVTREYSPPHYHIALFPVPYMEHVAVLEAAEAARRPPEFGPRPRVRASLHTTSEAGIHGMGAAARAAASAAAQDGVGTAGAGSAGSASGTGWRLLMTLPLALLGALILRTRRTAPPLRG